MPPLMEVVELYPTFLRENSLKSVGSCQIPHSKRHASTQLVSRVGDENCVDLDGGYCPSPQGTVLGNFRSEFSRGSSFFVICKGPVQSTSPGGGLRKAKIVSAVVSSHRRHPAQRTGPSFLCPTNQLLLLLPHSVCQSWAFSAQFSLLSMFSCFPKASSSATTLSPCQSQTLRVTCGIWLVKLFLSFQFYPPPHPPKKRAER